MWVPKAFAETDRGRLFDLVRSNSFGLLVTMRDGAPEASHLPFLLDDDRGENGTLIAHMARANGQWRSFDGITEALAIFQGPHAYVSPRWYDPTVNSVPTWNYAAVHAYGIPALVEDPARVRAILERLIETHEAGEAAPWRMDSRPEDYLEGMMRGVAAFEIPIKRLEGKFKLNQNHPEGNRRGAIAGLRGTDDPLSHAIAELMAAREDGA